MKDLYLKLKEELLATGVILQVELYANQITRLLANKNDAGVIGMPAVLVEFVNIKYVQLGSNHQQYTATVRLHTVAFSLVDAGLVMFDALEAVHGVASNLYTSSTTPLIRVADDTDNDFKNTCVNITDYDFRGTAPHTPQVTATPTTLGITVDVKTIL